MLNCGFDPQPNVSNLPRQVLHLLDLRQKRANIREAHAALQQAHETSRQTTLSLQLAEAAERQSKIVTVFTIITAVFLPLSFFASYFGMNVKDLSGEAANPYTSQDFWRVAGT
jgi:Mg2+ and Co2+ transporter CorA